MISELKPYPAYRDSGVRWWGKVPDHWQVLRANRQLRVTKRMIEPRQAGGRWVLHYSIPNVQQVGTGRVEETSSIDSQKIVVDRELLLVSKLNPRMGTMALARPHETLATLASSEFVAMEPRGCFGMFALYLYASEPVRQKLSARVQSATKSHQRCAPSDIASLRLAWPTHQEQRAIARFLNRAGRRIRRYIRAKERLIELLEEQKQALIHQAVTGKIDVRTGRPYPDYKDSGMGWMGDMPRHWKLRKLGRVVRERGGMTPSMAVGHYWGGSVPWVTPKDMKVDAIGDSQLRVTEVALEDTSLNLVRCGAVLMVVRGMILARSIPVAWTTKAVTINQDMKALTPRSGLRSEFLAVALRAGQGALLAAVEVAGHGTCRLPRGAWGNMEIPVPPVSEQDRIAQCVRCSRVMTDEAVERARQQIALAEELRTRLISEVVTGKLDVRRAAPLAESEAGVEAIVEEGSA